ncbi:YdcF family protein [Candidatus Saccharibacteria bacterium]|nr:YdcF family protein [Candidatus Saccharibacteria bacterium]
MTTIAIAFGRGPGAEGTKSIARKAAALWLSGKVDYVTACGRWSVLDTNQNEFTEAAEMRAIMIDLGVPADHILFEDQSRDNISNMTCAKHVMARNGIKVADVIFVTIRHAEPRILFLGRKILGRGFNITTTTSEYAFPLSCDEEANYASQERKVRLLTRASLMFIPGSQLAVVQAVVRLWHPGYQRHKVADPIKLTA